MTYRLIAGLMFSAFAGLSQVSRAEVADFNGLPEGDASDASILDPSTGLTLAGLQSDTGGFVIDKIGDDSGMPSVAPGTYFTSGGFAPGAGGTLAAIQSFTGTLPAKSGGVALSFVSYAAADYSVTINGQDAGGRTVASSTVPISAGAFAQSSISLSSSTADISSFDVSVSSADAYTAWGAISFSQVPEPTVAGFIAAALLLRRRVRTT